MNKLFYAVALTAAAGCFSLSSCVSKGKFLISQNRVQSLRNDSSGTHAMLSACQSKVNSLESDNGSLRSQNASNERDLKDLQDAASKSNMTIAEQEKRLKDLQQLIQREKDAMNKLRKSMADALVNFKPDELSVYIKDGKVYVSLQEKLLFKTGSDVVGVKGKQALGTLADVLNVTPDITVTIVGHTDTVPIRNARFQDNWALSVGRAASVVRILLDDAVDPHTIIASGRSKFHPVQSNETAEGRAQNRRTEIILAPNLSELYKLLGQ